MLGAKLARRNWWGPLLGASLFAACSSNNDFFGAPLTAGRGGVGGTAGNAVSGGVGGSSARGGDGAMSGASAGTTSGGGSSSGDAGTSTTGGSTTTGGAGGTTGGDAGTGGDVSTGGDAGTGGDVSTGGGAGTGGDVSTGGDAGTGGDVSGEGGTGLLDGGASGGGAGGESGAGAGGEGGTTGVGGLPSVGGMAGVGGVGGAGGSAGSGGKAGTTGSGGTPPDLTCLGDGDCDPGHYCQKTVCGASVGECTKQPPDCKGPEAEFEPVCGCDGMTYYSPCVAARDGADIASSGECTTNQATCTRAAGGSSCSPAHALARCYRPRVGCSGSSATTGVCWVMPDECAPEEKVNVYCNNGGTPQCVGLCEVLKDDLAVWRDSGTCP